MAAGISIASLFLPIAVVVIIVAAAFAVYKAIYKRRINKRLAEGREADIKPMMSPFKFVIVTLLGAVGGMILIWLIIIKIGRAHV